MEVEKCEAHTVSMGPYIVKKRDNLFLQCFSVEGGGFALCSITNPSATSRANNNIFRAAVQ